MWIAPILAARIALDASEVAAQVFPRPHSKDERGSVEREPWRRWRLRLGGSVGFPMLSADFANYWDPALGPAFQLVFPTQPFLDAVVHLDFFRLRFDPGSFERDFGAPPDLGGTTATLAGSSIALARFHPSREGWRPYADMGIGVLDISRPAIFDSDSSAVGRPAIEGVEIFGLDPCYTLGVGLEWLEFERWYSGFIEARFVGAPGRTEIAQAMGSLTAGVAVALPPWR
jgi:hypothetical protein